MTILIAICLHISIYIAGTSLEILMILESNFCLVMLGVYKYINGNIRHNQKLNLKGSGVMV